MKRTSINMHNSTATAVLVGHPSAGKSHLFNRLTGSNQLIGNWPGTTIEKKSGVYKKPDGKVYEILDLPGLYNLNPSKETLDENLTAEYLEQRHKYCFVLNIIDCTQLEKGLYLTLELLEKKIPTVLVLNKADLLKHSDINVKVLAKLLGIHVIKTNTITKHGIDELKNTIFAAGFKVRSHNNLNKQYYEKLIMESKLDALEEIIGDMGKDAIYQCRCNAISAIIEQVKLPKKGKHESIKLVYWLDKFLMHKYLGLPFFLVIMLLCFYTTMTLGLYFQDFIDITLTNQLEKLLQLMEEHRYLALVVKNLGNAIIIVLSLIPVLGILFVLLALLEDSGYIPRITILLDNIMSKLGLSGKSFIPIILGFGCNVPAIMAIRSIESRAQRIKLAMMLPFMSCSARLTVFSIFTTLFFTHYQELIIFSLYLIGVIIGLITAYIAGKVTNENAASFFIYELPRLSWPNPVIILRKAYVRIRSFALRAAKLIVLFSFCIMMLNEMLLLSNDNNNKMRIVGEKINYIFKPIGIAEHNWQFPYVMFSGVIAKEAMIASINSLYATEAHTTIKDALQTAFGDWRSIYAILVFILLYFPCVSVFSVLGREFGYKVAIISMVWSLLVGYSLAVASYYTLSLF